MSYCDYKTWKNGHFEDNDYGESKKFQFPKKIEIGPSKTLFRIPPDLARVFFHLIASLTHPNVKLIDFPGVIQCFVPNQPP